MREKVMDVLMPTLWINKRLDPPEKERDNVSSKKKPPSIYAEAISQMHFHTQVGGRRAVIRLIRLKCYRKRKKNKSYWF